MSTQNRTAFRIALMLAIVPATAVLADTLASTVELKIRSQASITGATVMLTDVLTLPPGGAAGLPDSLNRVTVADGVQAPATLVITYEQIAAKLAEQGINPARVLLGGAAKCVVAVTAPEEASDERQAAGDASKNSSTDKSLAQALRERIAADLATIGGTPEVAFERAGEPFLSLTTPTWEFVIHSNDRAKLGPREFQVTLRRDSQTVRTATIMARVQLSKEVLVARAPLNVGTLVQREALALEPRIFQREQDIGLACVDQALGQRAAKFVAAGEMVTAGDLKSEQLVQRSRPVSIIGGNGNLNVRLTGVALDSGVYGDQVRVRLGDSRQSRNVLRGTVTGISTVRVEDGR